LSDGDAIGFEFERGGERLLGFVLAHGGAWVAYLNKCPHWGVDLDFGEGRFYVQKVDRIVCRNHGALFVPSTGYCDSGPCAMDSLQKFEIEMEAEDAIVVIPDTGPPWLG
jgi:nitrite reductase/ring-hydroxylating ferredoxin subunit